MHWGARRHGVRVIRDPIHGDILLPKLAEAVVGSLEFQRLRYIRQNGLLHFVFPGAVHTRFAHSLGTMANAQAAWRRITGELAEQNTTKALVASLEYLGTVFELSALLHDVGHCAFSHSAEKVDVDDTPLFGTLRELCTRWAATPMLDAISRDHPDLGDERAEHEEIGLLLIDRIFRTETSVNAVAEGLGFNAAELGHDVIGLLHECPAGRAAGQLDGSCTAFPPTDVFKRHARTLIKAVEARWGTDVSSKDPVQQLRNILHDLISSTLDVDRLDYLLRDALFCGVPYGRYDREMLIGSLEIVPDAGRLYLTLDRKATFALDDMLWSRYQMFIQVYNHKTSAVMDHMLGRALEWAIKHNDVDRPSLYEQYVAFTDDLVMGTVFKKCSGGSAARDTPFGTTLTRRSVPKWIAAGVLKQVEKKKRKAELQQAKEAKEAELGRRVIAIDAGSEFIKGEMPAVRVTSKGTSKTTLEAYQHQSSILQSKSFNPSYHMVHFFEDPEVVSAGMKPKAKRRDSKGAPQ